MRPVHWQLLVALLVLAVAVGGYVGGISGPRQGPDSGVLPGDPPAADGGSAGQAPVADTGASGPAPPTPTGGGVVACQPGQAADYFPYQMGTQAHYAGTGNEYATYTVKVVHQSGNKVEWRKDNGGTVMAEVFQVLPQQVTRTFREGEAYDNSPRLNLPPNQSEAILKGPIQVGTTWTADNATHTIQSVTAGVQAVNQTLTCVVKVVAQFPNSITETYFHRQYGIVLSVFNPGPDAVTSRLSTFSP